VEVIKAIKRLTPPKCVDANEIPSSITKGCFHIFFFPLLTSVCNFNVTPFCCLELYYMN
jgi:hypothetical protein